MNLLRTVAVTLSISVSPMTFADFNWDNALTGDHRGEGNADRNEARHPRETLEFFGIEPGMTVMEVSPGGGWYTEVLAPLMKDNGTLIAAHYSPNGGGYSRRSLGGFLTKLGENDIYNQVEMFFAAVYDSLKPGGVFGIVQHRGAPGTDVETMKKTAYVTEEQVIEFAELAGFELDARSEINANARDTKDYPGGVWTLPPVLREGEKDRAKYVAIGESDRMTLRFRKATE